jgi:hypothetical protein
MFDATSYEVQSSVQLGIFEIVADTREIETNVPVPKENAGAIPKENAGANPCSITNEFWLAVSAEYFRGAGRMKAETDLKERKSESPAWSPDLDSGALRVAEFYHLGDDLDTVVHWRLYGARSGRSQSQV